MKRPSATSGISSCSRIRTCAARTHKEEQKDAQRSICRSVADRVGRIRPDDAEPSVHLGGAVERDCQRVDQADGTVQDPRQPVLRGLAEYWVLSVRHAAGRYPARHRDAEHASGGERKHREARVQALRHQDHDFQPRAQVVALGADARALGLGTDPSPVGYLGWTPVKVNRVIKDGDTVSLGGVTLRAVWTPGHTPGATTWVTSIADGGRTYNVVFPGGAGPNPGPPVVG